MHRTTKAKFCLLCSLGILSFARCDTCSSNIPTDNTDTLHLQQLISQESLLRMTLDKQVQEMRNLVYSLDVKMDEFETKMMGKLEDALSQQKSLKEDVADLEIKLRDNNDSTLTLKQEIGSLEVKLRENEDHVQNASDRLNEIKYNTDSNFFNLKNEMNKIMENGFVNLSSVTETKVSDVKAYVVQRYRELSGRIFDPKDKRISFSVSGYKTLFRNGTVLFATVITNEGNGYDNSTGVFIAPKTSHYVFILNVRRSGWRCTIKIVKNGNEIISNSHYSDDERHSGVSVVQKLVKGDQVWIDGRRSCFAMKDASFSGFEI